MSTYLDSEDEGKNNRPEISCCERQPRSRKEMIDVVHRTHDSSKGCQEET